MIINIKYLKYPSLNILKDRTNSISNESNFSHRSSMINKTLNYFNNDEETNDFNALYNKSRKINTYRNYHHIKEFLNFADDLYKKNYIDHSLQKKLKKLINESNIEVLSILSPYLNIKTNKSFDELAKKIKPVITKRNSDSEDLEESKQNSSLSSERKSKNKSSNKKIKNNKKRKSKKKSKKSIKKIKSKTMNKEEKILEDIKANFNKEKYTKLKEMLGQKDKDVVRAIKNFEKDNDYNRLLSKLAGIVLTSGSEDEEIEDDYENKDASLNGDENDSSYYVREDGNSDNNSKKNKKDIKHNSEELDDISKSICNALKNKGKILYFIAKYDLQKLKNSGKLSLFKKQFKLNIDKLRKDNYKIPKKNISNIKNYYTQYIQKKICKNFNNEEKLVYERLSKEEDDKKAKVEDNFNEDDEDGWITPENLYTKLDEMKGIHEKKDKDNNKKEVNANESSTNEEKNNGNIEQKLEDINVYVNTGDFTLQNVCMKMGIPIIGVDGLRIKNIKNYILKCTVCNRFIFEIDCETRKLTAYRNAATGKTNFNGKFPVPSLEAPLNVSGDIVTFNIFVDQSSIEIFTENGSMSMTNLIFPTSIYNSLSVYGVSYKAEMRSLNSIWKSN